MGADRRGPALPGVCQRCRFRALGRHPSHQKLGLCATCASSAEDRCPDTAADLDAMIAEQRKTLPGNDESPEPEPERKPQRERAADRVERTWEQWQVPPETWELTADTSREAILATHRQLVADAVRALGADATAERVSEYVCLPVWNVRRIIGEVT